MATAPVKNANRLFHKHCSAERHGWRVRDEWKACTPTVLLFPPISLLTK